MNCPDCQTKTEVEKQELLKRTLDGIKRRRVCKNCGLKLWTVEMPAEDVVVEETEE
jgi:transcriptional regulator NrdR family protein